MMKTVVRFHFLWKAIHYHSKVRDKQALKKDKKLLLFIELIVINKAV